MNWPVWVALATVAVSVLGLGLLAMRGSVTPDELPEPVHTTPPLDLPQGRELTAEDVRAVRFDTALRGYDPGPVDAHLEDWIQWLGSPDRAPAAPDAAAAIFPVVLRGYRMDQVDELLAVLER